MRLRCSWQASIGYCCSKTCYIFYTSYFSSERFSRCIPVQSIYQTLRHFIPYPRRMCHYVFTQLRKINGCSLFIDKKLQSFLLSLRLIEGNILSVILCSDSMMHFLIFLSLYCLFFVLKLVFPCMYILIHI